MKLLKPRDLSPELQQKWAQLQDLWAEERTIQTKARKLEEQLGLNQRGAGHIGWTYVEGA